MMAPDKAEDELQDILGQEEYQVYYEDNRNILEIWWDRFVEWLKDQLSKLMPSPGSSGFLENMFPIMIIILVVILIGVAIYFFVRKSRRRSQIASHQPLKDLRGKAWSYHDHLREASHQETNGNYTGATRHLFLALLLSFHEKGWLVARNWKTNWDYFAELRSIDRQDAEQFYHLAVVFDEVVYGERTLEKEAYLAYHADTMHLLHKHAADNHVDDGEV